MKTHLLPMLAGTALFATIAVAQAGEPMALSESQMDQVTAGAGYIIVFGGDVTVAIAGILYTIQGPTETRISLTSGSSGTARREEAVAAHRAVLQEWADGRAGRAARPPGPTSGSSSRQGRQWAQHRCG